MHGIIHIMMVGFDWCISIVPLFLRVAVRSAARCCSVLPVAVHFDRGHLWFRNINSTISVDVIEVKSYVDSFLDSSRVPVRISINKLELVPSRIVAVSRNG